MALTSTMYSLRIELAHVDRGVYESLDFRMAMHPSESPEYFVARLLAYCLEYAEGIGFSRGVSDPDDPTISVRDLTGTITTWIEIGLPDAARLHKASKAAPRVALYTHRDPSVWLRQIAGERIHKVDQIAGHVFDRELIDELVARLDRRMAFDLSVTDGTLFINLDGTTITGQVTPLSLASA
ncbi:MAG TPA: YaeQ family protein [Gemmatimonas sp.]|uniref:YaeQ family protein n=1 Tax=Gemmatimonas sp. TaxID=1962908 RepID=UPI002EDB103B